MAQIADMTTPMDRFIEQMGLMTQDEGAPRIAGQIHGYLLVEGEPRTLAQMAAALRISKASASTNARFLEMKGAVRRVSRIGQRGDAWEALEDHCDTMLSEIARRMRGNADALAGIVAEFPESHAGARARAERFTLFYSQMADFVENWLERLTGKADVPAGQNESKE